MLTNAYVYAHKQDIGEELIDTWGVAVADDSGECFLCPDVSVYRRQAEEFGRFVVANNVSPCDLQEAVCAYVESLGFIPA